MVGGFVTSAAYTVVVLANSLDFTEINGSIAAPAPPTTVLVPLLVLLIAAGRWSTVRTPAFVPYLAGTAATAALTVFTILIQPEGVIWGYFPSKLPWIWTLVGLTMLLLPFAHPVRPARTRRSRAVLAGGAASVLLAATALSPLTSPLLPARLAWLQSWAPRRGGTMWQWAQPTADSLSLAVSLGDRRERYVVYSVSPPDDRLTNFWLGAVRRGGRPPVLPVLGPHRQLAARHLHPARHPARPDRGHRRPHGLRSVRSAVRPHRREDPPARLGRHEAGGLGGLGDPVEQHLRRTDLVPRVQHDGDPGHLHHPEVHHDRRLRRRRW